MSSNAQLDHLYNPFLENLYSSRKAPPRSAAGGGATADKTATALKNHSEAEKRRRERINGHFATLRTLIPGSSKMDKATLLAEAIRHLNEVEKAATEATRGLVIPLDSDEVIVEEVVLEVSEGRSFVCVKASVCCDHTHELLSDLKQALSSLQLKLLRVELGTFRGRMKSVFFVSSYGEGTSQDSRSHNKSVSRSVKRALRSVLDRFSASQELSLSNDLFSSKRQRVSLLGCSSAISASGDLW